VPLARPYALNEAGTIMVGLRQTIPSPGVLGARSPRCRRRREDARGSTARARTRHTRPREARLLRLLPLLPRISNPPGACSFWKGASSNSRGRITRLDERAKQDVLRAVVDLSRLHNDVGDILQQVESSKALLNTLMARPTAAALGPPSEIAPALVLGRRRARGRTHPEKAGQKLLRRNSGSSAAKLPSTAARTEARLPNIMVGADYWYQPTSAVQHAYAAMVSINLPWLNARHGDEVREAEHALAADVRAFESARNAALYEVRDAFARLTAARQSFRIINGELLPQARQSFEAAQAAFPPARETPSDCSIQPARTSRSAWSTCGRSHVLVPASAISSAPRGADLAKAVPAAEEEAPVTTDPNHPPNLPGMDHVGEHFEEGEEAPPHGAHAMAIVRWALIGLMALAAVASVVYYFGGFHFSSAGESGTQYYCPNAPSIVQDHPGGVAPFAA